MKFKAMIQEIQWNTLNDPLEYYDNPKLYKLSLIELIPLESGVRLPSKITIETMNGESLMALLGGNFDIKKHKFSVEIKLEIDV